jgi:hypothetical protein
MLILSLDSNVVKLSNMKELYYEVVTAQTQKEKEKEVDAESDKDDDEIEEQLIRQRSSMSSMIFFDASA